MTKPEIGARHEIQLTHLAYSSAAVGRIGDMVTFVERGAPDDQAFVEIISVKKKHLRARLVNLISPSSYRCPPPCAYFVDGCGGCQWQHIRVEAQLRAKEQTLVEALKRIGRLQSFPAVACHAAPRPLAYRNNIRLMVASIQPEIELGFRQEGSHDVVPIDRCEIALPAINRALPQAAALIKHRRLLHVNEFIIRASATNGEALLVLILPKNAKPFIELADEDLRKYPAIHGVFTRNGERGELTWVAGKRTIAETVGGLRYRIGPDTFFQNNLSGLELLIKIVRNHVQSASPNVVIDAHCGVGTFTLPMAQIARTAFGIDLQSEAIELASLNAQINGLLNIAFRVGSLAQLNKIRADVVILDPPRGGCWGEDIEALKRLAPQHILYISCNPTTLARDLAQLAGYEISHIDLVDLFPMTYHFETVVWLHR